MPPAGWSKPKPGELPGALRVASAQASQMIEDGAALVLIIPPDHLPAFLASLGQPAPTEPKPELPPKRWLSVAETADHIGVGKSTVWNLTKDGELLVHKVKGRTVLDVHEVDAWMEQQ